MNLEATWQQGHSSVKGAFAKAMRAVDIKGARCMADCHIEALASCTRLASC